MTSKFWVLIYVIRHDIFEMNPYLFPDKQVYTVERSECLYYTSEIFVLVVFAG